MFTQSGFASRGVGRKLVAGAMSGILLLTSCGNSRSETTDGGSDDSSQESLALKQQRIKDRQGQFRSQVLANFDAQSAAIIACEKG